MPAGAVTAENHIRDAALGFACLGWHVLPLAPKSKIPPAGSHGLLDATIDLETIAAAWARVPTANVGIRTGVVSGLVVIDVDRRHGGDRTLADLEKAHGPLPETVRVNTPNGFHLYFRHPGGEIQSRPVAPGIDCKADGGYVVAPPSIHPEGGLYGWAPGYGPDDLEPAVMPTWLLGLVCGDGKAGRTAAQPLPDRIPEGQRNSSLASLAGSMRKRGASEDAIAAALLTENTTRCDPPLPESEVRSIAGSVGRYPPEAPITPAAAPTKRLEMATESAAALMAREIRPIQFCVEAILPEGLNLMISAPKRGKTRLAARIAVDVIFGGCALGNPGRRAHRGGVLFGAFEDGPRRMKDRLESLCAALGLSTEDPAFDNLDVIYTPPARLGDGLEDYLIAYLDAHPDTRLVILDTLGKIRQRRRGNGNAYDFDVQDLEGLQRIATERQVAILLIHHDNRAREAADWLDRVSGTQATAGTADTILYLDGTRGAPDAILRVVGRDVPDCELALKSERGVWMEIGDARLSLLSLERQAIVNSLRASQAAGITEMRLAEIAKAIGRPTPATVKLLAQLLEDNIVRSVKRGVYALSESL